MIVDCPPSLGQLTRSALAAAQRALLVTDPTMFAVSGVQRAFDAIQVERERERGNPDLQPLGVVINRVRPRNSEHEFRIAELRELFGPLVFSNVLPDRSAIQQAQGACLPIQRWDTPGCARGLGGVHHPARPRAADLPHPPGTGPDRPVHDDGQADPADGTAVATDEERTPAATAAPAVHGERRRPHRRRRPPSPPGARAGYRPRPVFSCSASIAFDASAFDRSSGGASSPACWASVCR